MEIVFVNLTNSGSTGKIVSGLAKIAESCGFTTHKSYPWLKCNAATNEGDIIIGSKWGHRINYRLSKYTGFCDCFSVIPTFRLMRKLNKLGPFALHLHNIHGSFLNLPLLFSYIKKHNIPVVWTLHDCWSFTGQCPYFTLPNCNKWKTGCYGCIQYKGYPASAYDNTRIMWKLKRKWFTGVNNLTIVTPSQWLADLVNESFLKDSHVKVINNGIDLNVFKPSPGRFREKYKIGKKYIVLGVAFGWSIQKGLDVFVELSRRLPEIYQIVLVGTDVSVDQQLPNNIISIHRTNNQTELAEIYTAADVFANPTREENYPTVNMEAIACGTPVITFRTGGSPEIVDVTCGCVVNYGDVDAMEREIIRVCTEKPYSEDSCILKSKEFNQEERFKSYLSLYQNLTSFKD